SAGTADWHQGKAPDSRSCQFASRRGYALESLRARQVCAEDFQRFDLILAMDHDNLARLQQLRPASARAELDLFLQRYDLGCRAGSLLRRRRRLRACAGSGRASRRRAPGRNQGAAVSLLIEENRSLKPFNTFAVEARASRYAEAHDDQDVREAMAAAARLGLP